MHLRTHGPQTEKQRKRRKPRGSCATASTDHTCCVRSPVGWHLGTAGRDSKSYVRKDREPTLKFKTVIAGGPLVPHCSPSRPWQLLVDH